MTAKLFYAVDLHIHTALSPCAEDDMTPRNIVKAAIESGLNIIAITDHNCSHNVEAVIQETKNKELIVIPGMEVESREGVHLLTLFPDLFLCKKWEEKVLATLPKVKNNIKYFGNQFYFQAGDIKQYPYLLAQSVGLTIDEICHEVNCLQGIVIPAHIKRKYSGILSVLGFLPENNYFPVLEISRLNYKSHEYENKHNIIVNSDAHVLADLYEGPTTALLLDKNNPCDIIRTLKHLCQKDEIIIF